MILGAALKSHLRAANRDKETHSAREPASVSKSCMYAGSWTDCEKAALQRVCHVNTTSLQSMTGNGA